MSPVSSNLRNPFIFTLNGSQTATNIVVVVAAAAVVGIVAIRSSKHQHFLISQPIVIELRLAY